MKQNNICYSPVNDCGGFGGNWWWNSVPQFSSPRFALFVLGNNTTTTNKYAYVNNAVTIGSNLQTNVNSCVACIGTSFKAIISTNVAQSPYSSDLTTIYVYSNDTLSNGSNLIQPTQMAVGSGNRTEGIMYGAQYNVGWQWYFNKYIYSSNTTSALSTQYTNNEGLSACGNGQVGLFQMGTVAFEANQNLTAYMYTYASDAVSTTFIASGFNTANYSSLYGVSFSNTTIAYIHSPWVSNLNTNYYSSTDTLYYFANNSTTVGSQYPIGVLYSMAAGNDQEAICSGGATGPTKAAYNVSNTYNYSHNQFSVGTNLSSGAALGGAVSNYNPGVNT